MKKFRQILKSLFTRKKCCEFNECCANCDGECATVAVKNVSKCPVRLTSGRAKFGWMQTE